jgi:uncharacterized membrane protein YphA (DoxX/SURF4 family)/peroxiredoxin
VLLTLRLLLAVVFVLAGVTKLLDLPGSRKAVAGFGVPARLSAPVGLLLPIAELVVAIALIPRATAWWGALGAVIMLTLFVVGIAVSVARGKAPDCHCFGQLYSEPVGRSTLVRNVALAVLAGFVLWQGPGTSAVEWVGDLSNAEWVLLVAIGLLAVCVIGQGFLFFNLMKQHGRLLLRLDALEAGPGTIGQAPAAARPPALSHQQLAIGSVAPAFTLHDLDEGVVTLADLLAPGKPVFLMFSDPGCGSCTALLPEIAGWQQACPGLTMAVISRGTSEGNRAKARDLGIRYILLQRDRETAQAYGSHATPCAVIVRPDGTIGSQVAVGPVAIRNLVEPWGNESADGAQASTHSGGQKHAVVTPGQSAVHSG